MKFAIFREIKKGKRKFLLEMDQDEIIGELIKQLPQVREYNIRSAFNKVVENFKKKTITIP